MTRLPAQLDDLPSNCVRPLGALPVATLRAWAHAAGQRFVQVDFAGSADKKGVLRAIGRALEFPAWYGANLDALYDCLTDLVEREDVAGWLIVLDPLPPGALDDDQRGALLDVFRDAAEAFADAGVPLRVLHAGPA